MMGRTVPPLRKHASIRRRIIPMAMVGAALTLWSAAPLIHPTLHALGVRHHHADSHHHHHPRHGPHEAHGHRHHGASPVDRHAHAADAPREHTHEPTTRHRVVVLRMGADDRLHVERRTVDPQPPHAPKPAPEKHDPSAPKQPEPDPDSDSDSPLIVLGHFDQPALPISLVSFAPGSIEPVENTGVPDARVPETPRPLNASPRAPPRIA